MARADAKYCSGRCRVAAHRQGVIPLALRKLPRWVRYSRKKVPLTAVGGPASATNPVTWSTYGRVNASTFGAGVGFVLNGDGIVCMDLDGCIAPSGVVTPPVRELLRLAGSTYVEVSPSGRGLHIWGRAKLVSGRCVSFKGQPVEVYPSGRYITVTGQVFEGSRSQLGDVSTAIVAVL